MKKLFFILSFILLSFASITTFAQQGDYDTKQRASYAIQTDSLFIYKTDTIPVTDITYHEWSADGLTWRKTHVITDRYLRISNDVKETFAIIDLMGLYPYWLQDGNTIYNNPAYSDSVLVDVLTGGNIIADYYFLGTDSLSLLNINSGAGTDGYVLVKVGNNAEWQPVASGGGNIARNVGTLGYGVLNDTIGGDFKFRNVASIDTFINVTLRDSSIIVGFDGTGRKVNAGIGLSGGGTLGADITFNLYVPELPQMADTVDYAADWMIINDATDGTHYKIHPQDLLDVLGQYTDSIGIGLDGNKFYLKEPQTVSETSDNVADANGHSHRFNMSSFELIDLGDVTDTPTNGQYLKYSGGTWITDSPSIGASNVSLYVNDTLRESSIPLLNIKEATGVNVEYGGSGEVEISSHLPVTIAETSTDLASIDVNQVLTINRQDQHPVAPEYGYIYNWYVTQENIAPTGWHVPTKAEFEALLIEIGGTTTDSINWPDVGGKLKEVGFEHWDAPNYGATDEYGFAALGVGSRQAYGFVGLKMDGSFLTSDIDEGNDITLQLISDSAIAVLGSAGGILGYSLRFIKDDSTDHGTVTDYDGNVYPTVKIGDQVWMAANFRGVHYNDGSPIDGPDFTDEEWAAMTTPAYCIYKQSLDEKLADIDHNSTKNKDGGDPINNYFGHVTEAQQALITEENIIHENRTVLDGITGGQSLNYSDNVTIDYNNGGNGILLLTGDVSLFTFANVPDGGFGSVVIIQDGTGGWSINSLGSDTITVDVMEEQLSTADCDAVNDCIDTTRIATLDSVQAIISANVCNYTVQTLTSNTDTLNVVNGVNAVLDISGNTTIRIEPTANCNTGNITVICDAAGYTLTFVGATMKFSPYVEATAGVITTTASAGALDVYSYFFDGTRIFINGTKAYE